MSRGYLLHVFDSGKLNYAKLAVCCALALKTNLKYNNVSIVLDEKTEEQLYLSISSEVISKAFDKIIKVSEKFEDKKRKHLNSPWDSFVVKFKNQNRPLSYDYSPYDETILIDVDYIVSNNDFDYIWNTSEDILINKKAVNLKNKPFGSINEKRLGSHGIPMYWATLVYFKKTKFAQCFFNLVEYIRQEYSFFQFIYGFNKSFYRNDFSFSIAAHILSGYKTNIKSFPIDTIITSDQKDTICKIKDSRELIMYNNDPKENWKNVLINTKGINLHIMNKLELLKISDYFIESCMEKLK